MPTDHQVSNFYECFENVMSSCSLCQELYILGDFTCKKNNYLLKSLDSFMKIFSLNQLIDASTRITDSCASVIDLILEPDHGKVSRSDTIPFCLSDHQVIYCT